MTALYILRKHPPIPRYYGHGHLNHFTIEAVSEYRTELLEIAQQKISAAPTNGLSQN